MEKKKKFNCSCFGFLRRKTKSPLKASMISQIPKTFIVETKKIEKLPEENFSIDRSMSTTQKLIGSSSNYRSQIVTPSRRTQQSQAFFPSACLNAIKPDNNFSIETSLSRPATLKEPPIVSAVFYKNQGFKELSKNLQYKIFPEQVLNSENPENNCKTERNSVNVIKTIENFEKNGLPTISEYRNHKEISITTKKQALTERNKNNDPSPFVLSETSPDLFLNSSKLSQTKISGFNISPINSFQSIDDFSDILSILNNPEKIKEIPDVFIRNKSNPSKLPILKPTTPYYFTKKRVLPTVRKDNKSFLNNMN